MPKFKWDPAGGASLRLGELLADVIEPRVVPPMDKHEVKPIPHPLTVVLNADCDLDWDLKERQGANASPKLVPYVLLCDAGPEAQWRTPAPHNINSTIMTAIKRNQNERYYHMVGLEGGVEVAELIMDFKSLFAIPTELLYDEIQGGRVKRLAMMPSPVSLQMSQRFHAFHGRIGLEDEADAPS